MTFGSSQLGKDKELLKKLKLGTITFALPSSVMASVTDEFGLFDMPYLVKDRAHMARIEKNVLWPKLAPTVNARDHSVMRKCACCHRHIDPVLNVDYDAIFCSDCISPMSDIDFPEYYCDIGGNG